LTRDGLTGDSTRRIIHASILREEPLRSNSAFDHAAGAAEVAPLSAASSHPETVRRLSPLASLIAVTLLSLATWAVIWAAVASLLPK
jgi:hypothetical protein